MFGGRFLRYRNATELQRGLREAPARLRPYIDNWSSKVLFSRGLSYGI